MATAEEVNKRKKKAEEAGVVFPEETPTAIDPRQREKRIQELVQQDRTIKQAGVQATAEQETQQAQQGTAQKKGSVLKATTQKLQQGELPSLPETQEGLTTPLTEFGEQFQQNALTTETIDEALQKNVGLTVKTFAQQSFDIYDNLKSLATGGDTLDVKESKEIITKANSQFSNELKLIEQGADPSNALVNLRRIIIANNQLSMQVKRIGLNNFRYWIRDGKNLETEIEINKEFLNYQYQQLLLAIQQGRANKAQAIINEQEVSNG